MTDVKKLITEHLDIWLTAETEKKSGRGRSSNSSNLIYGVQKLRELILELAFLGKLVPNEIKSFNLLEQILSEQKELVKNKILKKTTDIKIVDYSEFSYSLPNTWVLLKLADSGYNLGQKVPDSKFSYIDVSAINSIYGRVENQSILNADEAPSRARKKVSQGTIIYSTIRPYLNNIAVIDKVFEYEPIASTAFAVIHPYKAIDSYYLFYYLRSPLFVKYVESQQVGIAYPAINDKQFFSGLLPVPPLDEQRRIVAKVDELMQLCDQLEQQQNLSLEAHDQLVDTFLSVLINSSDVDEFKQNWNRISENFDLLFTTEYSIEQLKQTILQLAVTGKLVKLEAMDEMTKLEIHQHKINFSKKNSEANFVNFHGLNELKNSFSKNMELFRLGDIADIVRGGSPRPAGDLRFYEGNIPFLKVADITRSKGKFVEGHTSTIKEAGLHKTRFIDSRTVLLTNSGATLGVPAICEFPTTFNDGVAAFINLSNHVFDEYLYLYLSTLTKWFLNVAAQGQGQPNLNTDIVKSTWIALPIRKVQIEIVDMVDNLFSIIDQLQTLQSKLRKTKVNLADSFVANALLDSNDRNEAETEDNIIQFKKPIEIVKQAKQKSADQIDLFADDSVEDDIKLLSLAAEITFQLHTEPTFGHLKLQKLIYLCQQLKHMDLAADFKQHAAGPYDRNVAIYIDTEFKKRQWFSYHKDETPKYKQLRKCGEHKTDFERFFAKEASELNLLLGLFRTSKSDHIEIIATLFACWLRLLEQKQSITEEQLLKDFYAWSEEKKKFSKDEVLNGYKWMHQYSVIPQL